MTSVYRFICALLCLQPSIYDSPLAQVITSLRSSSIGTPGLNATFDYVVMGADTAGLTLATRLAQFGSKSVTVVEAGGFYELNNGNLSVVPSYDGYFTGSDLSDVNPLVDWGLLLLLRQ